MTASFRIRAWSTGLLMGLVVGTHAPLMADPNPDVREAIEERDKDLEEDAHRHLGRGILDRFLEPTYDALREKAREELGLDWVVQLSYLYQRRTYGGEAKWANNTELDIAFSWDLVDSDTFGKGSLNGLHSRIWEHPNGSKTAEVTSTAGTVFPISDSDKVNAKVRQLYWSQLLLDERLQVHLGQIELPTFIDDNSFANNDRDQFIAETWTKGTRSSVNIYGLGGVVGVTPNDLFYVRAGFVDGNTNLRNPRWSSFTKGEYIYAGEVAFTPTIKGWGDGIYRISPWAADRARNGEAGEGVSISFEQETAWDATLWLRGGISSRRRNNFKRNLGGGIVFTNPFGFNRDQIGLAVMWGRTEDSDDDDVNRRDNTYLGEAYWRAQLTERLEVGPHAQFHVKPADKRDRDVVVVGGLRAMARF